MVKTDKGMMKSKEFVDDLTLRLEEYKHDDSWQRNIALQNSLKIKSIQNQLGFPTLMEIPTTCFKVDIFNNDRFHVDYS